MPVEIIPEKIVGCLYRLTFKGGKSYIGITKHTAEKRFLKHVDSAKYGYKTYPLQHAINKHGADSVTVETLAVATWEYLVKLEVLAIAAFGTKVPNGYNATDGGEGVCDASPETRALISERKKAWWAENPEERQKLIEANKKLVLSADSRSKMSIAKKGIPLSEAHREKMREIKKVQMQDPFIREKISASLTGIVRSPETCAKIGACHKGMKHSDEAKARMSAANMGKKLSPENIAKLVALHTGVPRSTETKAKISAGHKGKKLSQEHRAKLSIAAIARCERSRVAKLLVA